MYLFYKMDGNILNENPLQPVFESPQSPDYWLEALTNATTNSITTLHSRFDFNPFVAD